MLTTEKGKIEKVENELTRKKSFRINLGFGQYGIDLNCQNNILRSVE